MFKRLCVCGVLALSVTSGGRLSAEEGKADKVAGHSLHGEAFDEGPRQKAHLLGGTGKVHLGVTSKHADVQRYFNQGVGQLHGFWYYEAERSFRQVAALDAECAMAYWGMAMANVNNVKRAKGFIQKAVDKKGQASPRERRWIDAYAAYWQGKKDDKERRRDLVKALEEISLEFPAELEAKAFLAFQIWDNNGHGWPIGSRLAVDALLRDILAAEPMHPAHHYMIHLWDDEKPVRALGSAARCGQAAPTIAHMWHMPGHTYSRLKRYPDAIWQQEASARADHRAMMRDWILPDQIHNYTHNNQWLVENLEYVGRAHDAVALAKNLIELPRHPRYNTLGLKDDGTPEARNHGSAGEGRRRLLETLMRYELWDVVTALGDTMYLESTEMPLEQMKRLHALGLAHFGKGDLEKARQRIGELEALLKKLREERLAAAVRAEDKARADKKTDEQVAKAMTEALQKGSRQMAPGEAALAELRALDHLAKGEMGPAKELIEKARESPRDRLARFWLRAGDKDKAVKLAQEEVAAGENQVFRLALAAEVLHAAGREKEARAQFEKLREQSAFLDPDLPVVARLAPLARMLGLPPDWRVTPKAATDVGARPSLDSLGPLYWQPVVAPGWKLPAEHGKEVALSDYRGRPVILIFFLGSGCPHCIEQLNAFEPLVSQFEAAGISLVAVSTDSVDGLRKTFEKSKLPAKIPLVSDAPLKVFREYRAYDDFEDVPLHGTYLIDGDGRLRWLDISYEPFTNAAFLLAESRRLLALPLRAAANAN